MRAATCGTHVRLSITHTHTRTHVYGARVPVDALRGVEQTIQR